MSRLLIRGARLVAGLVGPGTDPGVLHDVLVEHSTIASVTPSPGLPAASTNTPATTTLDAQGRVVLPGLVDGHTHACWADPTGDHRLDEWDQKRAGAGYLDILARGGGIMASVRAVRTATQDHLTRQLLARLSVMLAHGTTTVEVKSGYGLSTADELKMLRAIHAARPHFPGTIVPTALLGHGIDPDVPRQRFIAQTIGRTLPAVSEEFGAGIAVDAFCEHGAWTLDEAAALLGAAQRRGHPVRVHADQFNSLGMVPAAIELGARSVDHLEATTPADAAALAQSPIFAVGLPICGLHLDDRYANLGRIAAAQAATTGEADRVCIATNLNPGSAPCPSMGLVIALAVRKLGLDPLTALLAATRNPARLLGLTDRGTVAPGARADLVVTRVTDPRAIAWSIGENLADTVICGGEILKPRTP